MKTLYTVDAERVLFFLLGIVMVFFGSFAYNAYAKRKTGKALTNFQSFLFGTGTVYIMLILWFVGTFVSDYYFGSSLQGFKSVPAENSLFFAIFGRGCDDIDQYPIMSIDFNFLSAVIGGAIGGAALVVLKEIRSRKKGDDNGIFHGYKFRLLNPIQYIKNEISDLKSQVPLFEYILWWIMRIGLVYFLIRSVKQERYDVTLIISANLASTFAIMLARMIFFEKLFLGKINYRVQSMADIFIFFGNFLGYGFEFVGKVPEYDKMLHIVSGGVVVFIGCILINGSRKGDSLPRAVKTIASFGFSCLVMVLWEIFEFFADYYLDGINQNWHYTPSDDLFFFKLFGNHIESTKQMAVLDTNMDVLYALFGCVICTIILYIMLCFANKKSKRSAS